MFSRNVVLNGTLPVGTRATNFEDYEIEDRLYSTLDNITKYINGTCKFQIVGWAKRGEVMDQGVAQPSQGLHHTAAAIMVQSGSLNHHITKLDPMKPSILSQNYLDSIRFDVSTGFTVSE